MAEENKPGTDNPLVEIAWHDFIMWCFDQKAYVEGYEKATGCKIANRSILEQMIDQSTGAESELFFGFARYITENFWGMEFAPPAFREECARRDKEKEENRPSCGARP